MKEKQRIAIAAVIGAPNAGKSTLVNRLAGQKVTIVSRKVQTTRMRVRGVMIEGAAQIILVDTPGIFTPRRRLDEAMVGAAWAGAADAEIVLLMADAPALAASKPTPQRRETLAIIERLKASPSARVALVLNKVDEIERPRLLALTMELNGLTPFVQTFMVSALKGDGVAQLRAWLAAQAQEGPWLFPEDQAGDLSSRMLAAEITREKLFNRLHQELPYASHVRTERWDEQKDGSVRIEQTILVERDAQRIIAIGKGGATLKAIGASARRELEELLGRRVHLFLHVKVSANWSGHQATLAELGLDPKDQA